jgi:hypothetical protein
LLIQGGDVGFESETIVLPVSGPEARLGAMGYFAVLAYPERKNWPKRDELVDAFKAFLFKADIHRGLERRRVSRKYSGMRDGTMLGRVSRAVYRIQALRLPAARMASWKLIHRQTFGPVIKGTRSTILKIGAPKERQWAREFRKEYPNWEPTSIHECARLMAFQLEHARREWEQHHHKDAAPLWNNPDVTIESAARNVRRRVWNASMPVLHLAMVFPRRQERPDVIELVRDPSWLSSALKSAEATRQVLPQCIHSYDQRKAIRLLPASEQLKASIRRN